MKLILQQNVANLGRIGDEVTVKSGYARNFLIPQDKAIVATPENLKVFELRRAELEKNAGDRLQKAQQRAKAMLELSIRISSKSSDEGKLFGSVGPREIVEAVNAAGHELKKNEVIMPEGPIRTVGPATIELKLHSDVAIEWSLEVIAKD
tara:strand:+ start:1631 stop:2080 length:450 start_codon:yes stop_codon:yes gene_type:complete